MKHTYSFAFLILTLFTVAFHGAVHAQPGSLSLNSTKDQVWKIKAQAGVDDRPESIAGAGYATDSWVQAVVPGTVFAAYVNAGLEKDPNFGDNIYKVDKAKYDRNFWYRTEFAVPVGFTKEKTWLNFKGINRKADIYLNGNRIGSLDGFMQRGQFDITGLLSRTGKNVLAVLVYWPRTSLANYSSPTYLPSASWDWMPYVPGLNMGITDHVWLSNTGALTIHDPWVRADLPTNARAELKVSVEVRNNSDQPLQGMLNGVIQPGNITFSQKVSLGANSKDELKLDSRRLPQLIIHSPKLWWPNGYGRQAMYTCQFSLSVGGQVSDSRDIRFGIRKYSFDTAGHVLHVAINGTKVFIKGGNWGMSEYMLRCRGEEYDTKVRLHKEMNFNMIRNWTGATTDEEFYEACDKYGIMVWDDFWLNANPNLPNDLVVFNANVIEKLKKLRNHPSIAVWCADNEGWPEPPLSGWLKEDIKTFDGDEGYYQPNSHAENLTGSGPWANFDPRYYFTAYPSGSGGNQGWGLRTELGTAVFTNFESFKKFMPKDKWWPRNDMWNLHFFGPLAFNAGPDRYDESIATRYGPPNGIEDYCRKAQLLNIETNKAMYEGWQDHIWEDASGIMTWMSQSAYPSLVWQTYDYYYDLTGAWWGAKKACEPLHIQWNPATNSIKVVNTTGKDVSGLTAEAAIYNLDGKRVDKYTESAKVDAPANSAVQCFELRLNTDRNNLALNKPVVASSTTYGQPTLVTDGKKGTRWSSNSGDNEWIYVDLGAEKEVNGVGLDWEDAYGKSFKIQVSDDAQHWRDVYSTTEGMTGEQKIDFVEVPARYVRLQGVERGTYWGYSLWNFEVYEGNRKSEDLSDVHFIKLQIKDKDGRPVADNFYWRGNRRKDFTALNTLPKVNLKVTTKITQADGIYSIHAQITNPASSPAVAFAIRVQAIRTSNGEQILPAFTNDNYFSLLKGETKEIQITFQASMLGNDTPRLLVEPYNN
jgi:hypothetical protein